MNRGEFLKQLGLGLYRLPQNAAGMIMLKYTGMTENMTDEQLDELGDPLAVAERETDEYLSAHPHSEARGAKLTTLGCLVPACITVATLLFTVLVLFLIIDPLSKRVHIGNRVKGEITVTLDGRPVDIESLVIEGEGSGRQRVELEANRATYSFRGNKYEVYDMTCGLGDGLPEIDIAYAHWNWWEESKTKVLIDIVTGEDGAYSCSYSIEYSFLGEDNRWKTDEKAGECEAENGRLILGYGS